MTPTQRVPLEEYSKTVYEPDVDYVDGVLEERNVGELDHADLQFHVATLLAGLRRKDGKKFAVYPELRLAVSGTRRRISDVCVFFERPQEQVPSVQPLVVLEILSPEDGLSRLQEKLDDYHRHGCQAIWVLDPQRQQAFRYDGVSLTRVMETLDHPSVPELTLRLADIFS